MVESLRALLSIAKGFRIAYTYSRQFFDNLADQSATNGAPQAQSSTRHRSRKGAGAEKPPLAQGE